MSELAGMRVLICNDDGIAATGIESLERLVREITEDVWVVAPETDHSGAGHSLTLAQPVRVRKLGERRQIEPLPFMQRVRIGPVHQQVGATRYRHHVGVLAFDTHGLVEGSGKVDLHHSSSASGAATANPSMMPS